MQPLLRILLLVGTMSHRVGAGCQGKCCPGTDNTCSAWDWRMDRVYGTCFCDAGCARTRDCCYDYPTVCPAESCQVSQWSQWSGCSQQCRPAYRQRIRHIQQQPRNQGDACPILQEKSGCLEYFSAEKQNCAQVRGPALITTADYGRGRSTHDRYGAPLDPGYCVEFRMATLTPHCGTESRAHGRWMHYLREGFTVCVGCQPPALHQRRHSCQGDGTNAARDELLHWQAVGNPRCRGTWARIRRLEGCHCPQVHHFIFT